MSEVKDDSRALGIIRPAGEVSAKRLLNQALIHQYMEVASMSVPVRQMWTIASYVLKQRMLGNKRYPLVLMLEPLFRCNLACAGCGKIQHPVEILRKHLSPEECFAAADECGAPVISIPAANHCCMHPQIGEIVAGLVARKSLSTCARCHSARKTSSQI